VTVTDYSEDFTIDAVIAVPQTLFNETINGVINNEQGIKFVNTSPYILEGGFTADINDAASVLRIVGTNNSADQDYALMGTIGFANKSTTNVAGDKTFRIHPGCELTVVGGLAGSRFYAGSSVNLPYIFKAVNPPKEKVFWVPTGTDLDGTRYVVELFNIAT